MVQTLKSIVVGAGEKLILFEKPYILKRVFFSVKNISAAYDWFPSKISFDDPLFTSFYLIGGTEKYFEARGVDVFQGNIWLLNDSSHDMWFAATEILH